MSTRRAALFLDRDGVINVDSGHPYRPEDIVFIDGIFDLCRAARERGDLVVVVTNQAGIARGLYSEAAFHELMEWMAGKFIEAGAVLDGIYHCPHHPVHGLGSHRRVCDCRKPAPGLILSAQHDLSLDLSRSALVGDKMSDIEAARRAGVGRRILLSTERPATLEAEELALPTHSAVQHELFGVGRHATRARPR